MLNRVEKDTIEDKPLKIGALLVNEGFIRNADLEQAIGIQENEARQAGLPLGKLLVKKKLIDRQQLQSLLQHPEVVREIETFAVESAGIDPQDLARCIAEKPAHQPLVEALTSTGLLTEDNLKLFFQQQLDSLKICELAVETGMVSEADMSRALRSKRIPRTIGEILCDLNLISPLDLNAVMAKHRKRLRLGEILLRHELIDRPTFEQILGMHERQGEPLGSILRRKGILSEDQLYEAFALQYNIPFKKLEAFEYSAAQRDLLTRILDRNFSDRFHIIPLRLEENTLTVAVSDPVNLESVNSFRSKRVDLRTRCVMVTPAVMGRLYNGLYNPPPPPDAGKNRPNVPEIAEAQAQKTNDEAHAPRPAASRLPASNSNSKHREEKAAFEIILSSGELRGADLQGLHHAYEKLVKETGRRSQSSSLEIFETFIKAHHNAICRRYGASRVAFCIKRRGKEVSLLASPLLY